MSGAELFGDSLDGTVARVGDCQRSRYGFYVDLILDAIGMSVLMTGMAFSGYISPAVAAFFLIVNFPRLGGLNLRL